MKILDEYFEMFTRLLSSSYRLQNRFVIVPRVCLSLLQPVIISKDITVGEAIEDYVARVYPEKFEKENRSYVNIWQNQKKKQTYVFGQFSDDFIAKPYTQNLVRRLDLESEQFKLVLFNLLGLINQHKKLKAGKFKISKNGEDIAYFSKHADGNTDEVSLRIIQMRIPDSEICLKNSPRMHGINVPFPMTPSYWSVLVLHSDRPDRGFFELEDGADSKKYQVVVAVDDNEPSSPLVVIDSNIGNSEVELETFLKAEVKEPFYKEKTWEHFDDYGHFFESELKTEFETGLKIITYNTLGNKLSDNDQWKHLKREVCLSNEYRRQLLHSEMLYYQADVIGIQEFNPESMPDFYVSEEIGDSDNRDNSPLGIAYNPKRVKLLSHKFARYSTLVDKLLNDQTSNYDDAKEKMKTKKQKFYMANMQFLGSTNREPRSFLFVNTHLNYNTAKIRYLQPRFSHNVINVVRTRSHFSHDKSE